MQQGYQQPPPQDPYQQPQQQYQAPGQYQQPDQYQQPGHEPKPQQPKGKSSLIPVLIVIIVVIVVIGVLAIFLLGSSTVQMTPSEWQDEYEDYGYGLGNFPSLDAGDTVEITGRITDIEYYGDSYFYYSYDYSFLELDNVDFPLNFEGDLTDYYDEGDRVTITLHIEDISLLGISIEYIEELGTYGTSSELPRSVIERA